MAWGSVWEMSPDPWQALERMQAEMDRLFHRANDSYAPGYPPVDVWVKEDEVLVEAELPGVDPKQVEISVLDDELTLRGSRSAAEAGEEKSDGARLLRQERGHGEFSRTFRLPFRVEASAVDARYANGILEIRLPRAEADRPRRIEVRAS